MKQFNLCLLGFGNVGRSLVRLLLVKRDELRDAYEIEWRITGVATRSLGWIAAPEGLDTALLLSGDSFDQSSGPTPRHVREWLDAARADVLFETTSLEPHTGEPAISHVRAALEMGAHTITANKGTIVHGYSDLKELAHARGRRFMFEATVADCLPVFSLFRETLPAARLLAFSGILNSTTSVILEEMERGATFEDGVRAAQKLGITETDPSYDVDGWDAAVKVCALARVLMDAPLKLDDVRREGIRKMDAARLRAARETGSPYRLVARAERTRQGRVNASVRPEQIPSADAFASVAGTSLMIRFELDVLPALSLIAHGPDLQSTAYGLLADFINAVRTR